MFKPRTPLILLVLLVLCASTLGVLIPANHADAAIVQCGRSGAPAGSPESLPCTICDILKFLKNIIDFITFKFTPVAGGLLITFAGFLILLGGANTEMVARGRSMLTKTVIGAAIIFMSFMIANFVIKSLAGDNDTAKSWFQLDCAPPRDSSSFRTPTPIPLGGGGFGGGGSSGTFGYSDAEAREILRKAGIAIGYPACGIGASPCSNFAGMEKKTMDEILALKRNCNCAVQVNDVTGPGHTGGTHALGISADIQHSPQLDAYITNPQYFTKIDATHYQNKQTGAIYFNEDSGHWHMTV